MNVLLVEDDLQLANLLAEFLEQRGHHVTSCCDAEEAWSCCVGQEFPLILMDWMLPGEPGIDLCRKLRGDPRFRFSLIVMVTVKTEHEDLALALGAGVDDFIAKPVDWDRMDVRIAIAERRVALLHDRSQVQAALEESEHKEKELLERTARLTSVGVLAAGFAHEINNPLQGMQSHLSAVRRHTPPDFAAAESLDMLDRGIRTISGLVRRLLVLGVEGDTSGGKASCDEAISFVTLLLRGQLQKANVEFTVKHEDSNLHVRLSQRKLIQVLLNLILNAVDAMPNGGTITVTTSLEDELGVVAVSDTGTGMSAEVIKEIFVPFFTTKAAKGTGLGLSMSEAIVRNANGRMEVRSEEGKGSTFLVFLPIA